MIFSCSTRAARPQVQREGSWLRHCRQEQRHLPSSPVLIGRGHKGVFRGGLAPGPMCTWRCTDERFHCVRSSSCRLYSLPCLAASREAPGLAPPLGPCGPEVGRLWSVPCLAASREAPGLALPGPCGLDCRLSVVCTRFRASWRRGRPLALPLPWGHAVSRVVVFGWSVICLPTV